MRRTSVTMAARQVQAVNIIEYRRGRIEIADLDALQEASRECSEAVIDQVARLVAVPH